MKRERERASPVEERVIPCVSYTHGTMMSGDEGKVMTTREHTLHTDSG